MQIKDLNKFVSKKTIDEYYVDFGQAISMDEFNKHIREPEYDHREATIDRLVESKVSFVSNANILYNLMKRYVKVECPICHAPMVGSGGGGSGDSFSTNYRCEKCYITISLSLCHDGFELRGQKD